MTKIETNFFAKDSMECKKLEEIISHFPIDILDSEAQNIHVSTPDNYLSIPNAFWKDDNLKNKIGEIKIGWGANLKNPSIMMANNFNGHILKQGYKLLLVTLDKKYGLYI